ncbi:MAG: crotonase/enoyl-CoA hydratase family protein [Nevskia sp.]
MHFTTLRIDLDGPLAWLRLNRPDKANAMNRAMWDELPQAVAWIDAQPQVRVLILCGEGRHFTAGIDLEMLGELGAKVNGRGCAGRAREDVRAWIMKLQDSFSCFEALRVPVIAAISGACVGAGVDLISACDLRYGTYDAKFCIKEVDLAIVADVGTLQRLRHVIGLAPMTELTYSAETFDGHRALALGLLNGAFETRDEVLAKAEAMARLIASKSPLTVRGIKKNLLYSRDHTVAEGLEFAAGWNAAMLISEDASEALSAFLQKRAATFAD